ncbi:MAG TPA: hypothetical protein VHY84_18070 [Bryobacteraceae bacterium]|jgi:YD repeat-containing protein|nr:hypothetical protein [Bryobacteraceae bacterium]
MTRRATTQTRTFVYDTVGRLTSATNPENGTVTYTYNTDNTLQYRHDAKGQDTVYTYDMKKRVTQVSRYPNGKNNAEDTCARVAYIYDVNPAGLTFSSNTYGRLAATEYSICTGNSHQTIYGFMDQYSYAPGGAVTAKALRVGSGVNSQTMAAYYG